ncbi:flagellar hook protein [Nibricoccus aquaticus]|uniref:Flagellar hook-associated protein 2 n=1 Tax=Nibricoccus aquaticus TaxID=2576891 RepID=A0A290QJN9_9BACT|nr:flagellar filament capping protein FliD [Nibricoccus aquaticus]ATC64092.1 flagellar hook protein [Nibricoccus aquaticus]
MASIQLSGLISGFDWKSFMDEVMELNRAPITRLQAEKTTNNNKVSALDNLGTRLNELQTASRALKSEGLFTGRSATSTTTGSSWSTSATSGTATGAYNFNVTQLATTTKRSGAGDIGLGLSATNNVTGVTIASMPTATAVTAGDFTVNGAKITVALTDSLQDVFDKISTATSGAVVGSYDSTTDKISLTSVPASNPITLGASNDTSNFLAVARLANGNNTGVIESGTALGATSQSAPLASSRLRNSITAVDGSGNGTFTVNGVSIAYNVNTDSLSAVLGRISSSSAGVNATYDAAADRVVLTNKSTGDLGLSVSEAAGGFLDAVGLSGSSTLARGDDAQFTVNGGPTLTSTSNTFTAASHGITGLSLTANTEASQTITVDANTTGMKGAIDEFIKKFNAVQSYIDTATKITSANGKVTSAVLANNREIQSWQSTLRSTAFSAVSGLSGTISRLENLGIDFTAGTSELAIKDPSKLEAALRDKPSEVEAFFKTASTGFAAKFETFNTSLIGTSGTGSGGMLGSQKETLTKGNTSIDQQIANIERQLASEKARMEAGFLAMENAQATIKNMSAQLTSAFSSTSNS